MSYIHTSLFYIQIYHNTYYQPTPSFIVNAIDMEYYGIKEWQAV